MHIIEIFACSAVTNKIMELLETLSLENTKENIN